MVYDLLDIGEDAIHLAEKLGAAQAEAYVAQGKYFEIAAENNAIKSASESIDVGIGIRTIVGKKIGFAYVTTLNDSDIHEAVANSISLARASIADPDFLTLPTSGSSYHTAQGLFDRKIDELTSEETADLINRIIDETKQVLEGRNFAIDAGVHSSSSTVAVVNSLGIAKTESKTFISLSANPIIKDDDQTVGHEFQLSRTLNEINPEWVGRSAAELAIGLLRPKTIEGGEMPVVFAPLGASAILGRGLADAVNAEEVQMGRSYIADALGEEIASETLEIVDDGLLSGGIGTRSFDAEGFPTQRTPVIKVGVLKSLLHNSYTANKEQVDNTGNASRPSYSGLPSISTTNFIVSPGRGDLNDLISELDKGVVCRYTGDSPNMTTGDLSAMIVEGYYVENGAIQHPLKNTLIGINMRDLLKRISRVGNDSRTTFSTITPSIVVERANITSG
jgi:PmbA protein